MSTTAASKETQERSLMSFNSVLKHLATAGAIARTCIAPFERIIILKQTANAAYRGQSVPGILRSMVVQEGPLSLFKGNWTNVLRIMPHSSIELFSFEIYKKTLNSLGISGFTEKQRYLVGGALAGMTATAIVYPLDLVRTIFAFQTERVSQYNGIFQTWRSLVAIGGVRSLYSGLGMTCMGIAPYASLKLTIFQLLKNWFYTSSEEGDKKISNVANLSFGALSGCLAVSVTYPTDLIRRKIQISTLKSGAAGAKGIRQVVRETYATSGVRGFYQGLGVTYMKVIPSVALTFMLNERIKLLLFGTRKAY